MTVEPTLAAVKDTTALPLEVATMRVLQSRDASFSAADQMAVVVTEPVAASIGLAVRSPVQPAGL